MDLVHELHGPVFSVMRASPLFCSISILAGSATARAQTTDTLRARGLSRPVEILRDVGDWERAVKTRAATFVIRFLEPSCW